MWQPLTLQVLSFGSTFLDKGFFPLTSEGMPVLVVFLILTVGYILNVCSFERFYQMQIYVDLKLQVHRTINRTSLFLFLTVTVLKFNSNFL